MIKPNVSEALMVGVWKGNIDVGNDLVKCRERENEIVHLLLSSMIDIYEKLCC